MRTRGHFDNEHVKEYPCGILVGVRLPMYKEYDGLNYKISLIDGGPERVFDATLETSIADIVFLTGMVKSKAELKRLLKQNGIKCWQWNTPFSDIFTPICQITQMETEFLLRKGQRVLEIVVEGEPAWVA